MLGNDVVFLKIFFEKTAAFSSQVEKSYEKWKLFELAMEIHGGLSEIILSALT